MPKFLLLITPKQPKLTSAQLQTLINIATEIGVIGMASIALPILFDKGSNFLILSGVVIAILSWWFAFWLAQKLP